MSPYSFLVKKRARELRARGFSFREISERLGMAKSTASLWTRDVKLGKVARKRLAKVKADGTRKGRLVRQKFFEAQRKKIKLLAQQEFRSIPSLDRTTCKLLLSLLFWCEGSKKLCDLRFTNSDPELIALFLSLMRKSFEVDEKKFRCSLHLHGYHNQKKQLDYWSKITHISKRQFIRPYRKPNGGKRIRTDYQGCLSVYYYDASKAKELYYLYKELKGV